MTNPNIVLKSRGLTLLTKVCTVKAMVFPVITYGCESSTRQNAKELMPSTMVLEKKVPWTARRSNQSILKKINPDYSLEGLRLRLKLQYFGHLM